MVLKQYIAIIVMLLAWALPGKAAARDVESQIEEPIRRAIEIRRQTQLREDRWQEEKQRLLYRYEMLAEENARLEKQKESLIRRVGAARERLAALKSEQAETARFGEELIPYLESVYTRWAEWLATDLPFLKKEREARRARVQAVLHSPDTTVGEKFRRVMEALFVEAEYGNTSEVYRETIMVNNEKIMANIFRLGRMALFFQSLDGTVTGVYDVAAATWRTLPRRCNRAVNTAFAIGTRRRPVELITLPLGRLKIQ